MKTTMKLSTRLIATAVLALGASAASAGNLQLNGFTGLSVYTAEAGAFGAAADEYGVYTVTPGLFNVTYDSKAFLAFCADPFVPFSGSNNSYSSGTYAASDAVKRLFEGFYASSVAAKDDGSAVSAFQLALWELNNDNSLANGSADLLTGQLRFDDLGDPVVAAASAMLSVAHSSVAISNSYNYTSLTSVSPASQSLLTVSAVPEAQTWAMMLAGLGMLGFLRRRKSA